MGFWDFLKRPVPVAYFTPNVNYLGHDELAAMVGDLTPAQMWETQPHLRTVISYLARNIAQLGLHCFTRDGDDRERDRTSPLATALRSPNPDQTAYDLVFALVGDLSLYDRAYWLTTLEDDGWRLRRLPPTWVTPIWRDVFGAKSYRVLSPSADGGFVDVSADQVLAFSGYHPSSSRKGSPTIEALKGTLQEQIEASNYRKQVWKRGGRVSAVLQRPKEAPAWSPEAADRFREDWHASYSGNGPKAGGTPILEDGMTLNRIDFTAQEQQFVEAAKLSFSTVASAFHVNPTMVGILDNANYSNVREFRRMLYGDTLGPLLAQIEARVNSFLVPRMGMDPETSYVEFNIAEKLQGSFEEQQAALQTAIGAPWMTINEGRARQNMPSIPGGDVVVQPLNLMYGGQLPGTQGQQNETPKSLPARPVKAAVAAVKAAPSDSQAAKVAEVLHSFFERQGKAVLSRIGSGGDWWDKKRWDDELTDDLLRASYALSEILGKAEAERLGFPAGYNPEQTAEFLKTVAARRAESINSTTKAQLDDTDDHAHVFTVAKESRASGVGALVATAIAGFAVREAAEQIGAREGLEPTKTWVVNSTNPRSAHAQMNGETVPVGEPFSNGMQYPGDYGDVEEVAGCQCSLETSIS